MFILNRKWQDVAMRLRVFVRLKCLMVAIIKVYYYMLVTAARLCRAVVIQMWYRNQIHALYESVHSISR